MSQGFVKNAAQIHVQHKTENIPQILISAHELQRKFCELHRIPSSKLNKTLEEIIITFYQTNNTFLNLYLLSTESLAWKQWRVLLPAVPINRRPDACFCMEDGFGRRAIQRNVIRNYRVVAPWSYLITFDIRMIATMAAPLTVGVMKDQNRRGEAKSDGRDVSSRQETFGTRRWSLCGSPSHSC